MLNENKATYPEKISYNNPPHLSIEALEIHYRINASILKYLELHEGKPIPDIVGKMFKQCLESAVFPKAISESDNVRVDEMENKPKTVCDVQIKEEVENTREIMSVDNLQDDIKECIEYMLTQVENEWKQESSTNKVSHNDIIMIDDSDEDATIIKGGIFHKCFNMQLY